LTAAEEYAICKHCEKPECDNCLENRKINKSLAVKRSSKWAKENPERAKESRLSWQNRNADHVREYHKAYYQKKKAALASAKATTA